METKYDPLTQYCPTRRDLEERSLNLVGRLTVVTEHLLRLIGRDHGAFLANKAECRDLRTVIVESRRQLQEHRLAHGC